MEETKGKAGELQFIFTENGFYVEPLEMERSREAKKLLKQFQQDRYRA